MERLQEALPQFDQKSLLNATFAMRQKGLVEFDRSGVGQRRLSLAGLTHDSADSTKGGQFGPLFLAVRAPLADPFPLRHCDHCEEEMIMRALPASIAALLIAMPAFAQDKATIDKLNTEFMAAFAKGDMAALGQMYTEDAYLLPPDSETVKGRAAIQTFWTNAAAAIGDLKLTTVDVKPLGSDAAREIGDLHPEDQRRQAAGGRREVRGRLGEDRRTLEAGG